MQEGNGAPLSAAPTAPRSRGRSIGILAAVFAVGYAADQGTKAWAQGSLTEGVPREFIGSLLKLNLTHNPGAAFSIATSATWLLSLIAIAVIVVTVWSARRLRSAGWAVALGLLLAGALGNLTDRFFRPPGGGRGHVVDFLQLPHWPIFNVADICVDSAAVLIVLLALRGISLDGTRAAKPEDDRDAVSVDDEVRQ